MMSVRKILSKKGRERIVALTSYFWLTAKILDEEGVDIVLVGDSMAQVLFGARTTAQIPFEVMLWCAKSVRSAVKNALVVFDMPFGTFHTPEVALEHAVRVVKEADVDAVKLEGGKEIAHTVKLLVQNGIPVMGHIGLLPQRVRVEGLRRKGKTEEETKKLEEDALALEDAGVFSVVLEAVEEEVARKITKMLSIPTIGIGSGSACDGEIAVLEDIIGLTENPPPFAPRFANTRDAIRQSVKSFVRSVRNGGRS